MEPKESIYSFAGGFIVSVLGNISWIGQISSMSVHDLLLEWTAKIFGTVILGVMGGLAGLFAKDLYKVIKNKIKH